MPREGVSQPMFSTMAHTEIVRLLDVQPMSRIVDLGCGPCSFTMIEAAAQLGPHGSIVGVDIEQRAPPDDLAGDARCTMLAAEFAEVLPFADGRFDRAICHNVLECLPEPAAFLGEVWRILSPGALLVLGHSDFDTIVFASENLELTRQLVQCFCDMPQNVMTRSDGTMGRKLRGIAAQSPFRVEGVVAWADCTTSFEESSPGRVAARAVAGIARRNPDIDDVAINEWLAGLERTAQNDAFLYSINDYAVLCRKDR